MRTSLLLGLAAALAVPAAAQCTGTEGTDFQRVTLREVNALPQSNIDALNAGGADLTFQTIEDNVVSPLNNQRIEFSAVFLTNPLLSGLGSPSGTGTPNRYHVFVRDTAAETDGVAGMGGQLVDGDGISTGAITGFGVGDEVTICGQVSFFGTASQINPESITLDDSRTADDPILDPVVITTDDIHDSYEVGGEAKSQVDWDVYADFVNQYVRLEGTELVQGTPGDRPNMLFSTSGELTTLRTDNLSVCYDNRRQNASYYPGGNVPACVSDGAFVPPATGVVNVQGFLSLRSAFDAFSSSVPPGGAFAISPFEAADFEVTQAPPIITAESDALATASAGVPVSATVLPGTEGRTITSASATYSAPSGASGTVQLTNTSGDTFEGTIPGVQEGDFVTFTVTATDSEGFSDTSDPVTRRVVGAAVTSILEVQQTATGGPGPSGITTSEPVAFDLDAVVMTAYTTGARYQVTIQDDPSLGPFSGVIVDFGSEDPGLAVGDMITISQARVSEFRDVTQIVDATFTVTGQGDPYADKVVTTNLFAGSNGATAAEQHEGMVLRFENVEITSTNPDAPSGPFGEFAFSSDGTEANALRADDLSDEVPADFAASLSVGLELDYIRGFLSFSFGNYKLIPITTADVDIAGVAVGTGPGESAVGIAGAYPNPSAGAVRVRFELAAPGEASLRLYDLTGREVAVVAEGAFSADVHDVTADLSGLASGVYVLRLSAGGDVATARLAVVR